MNKSRIWKIVGFICIFGVLLSGCGKEENKEITIGYFPNITHAQALMLKQEKVLETAWEGKNTVNWVAFNAGPAEVEALFAEEVDIGYIGPVPAINAYVKSQGDVIILAGAADGGAVLLGRKDAGIESVSELDGKKVAIPQIGNTQHLCLLELLAENNLTPATEGGTVEVVAVANADIMNMMEAGNIDAALVPEPWGSILEAQCGAELILDYDEIMLKGNYPTAVVVAREEFVKEHPQEVETFLTEHKKMTEKLSNNTQAICSAVNMQIEEETGKKYEETTLQEAFTRIVFKDEVNQEAIDAFAEICYRQGFIQEKMKDGIIR